MTIRIEYCRVWNYQPRAARLAATLKEKLQLETQLVAGGRGAFEVFAEDQLLFSKLNEGRFPEEQEMVDLLR